MLELAPGLVLHRTGGHFDGHSVLHDRRRGVLFCGDSLKVDLADDGTPVALSAHKAFHAQIPLSHGELREYLAVVGALEFGAVAHAVRGRPGHHHRPRRAPGPAAAVRPAGRRARAAGPAVMGARSSATWRRSRTGCVEFAVTGLDPLDVPLHSAAVAEGPDCPAGSGLGYGATPEEARTGALGEMAEMALSTRSLAGRDAGRGVVRRAGARAGRPGAGPADAVPGGRQPRTTTTASCSGCR